LDQFESAVHALFHFLFALVTCAQAERDVLEDVQVWEEGVVLKDHAEAASLGWEVCDVLILKED
jgi:hypothetical protein